MSRTPKAKSSTASSTASGTAAERGSEPSPRGEPKPEPKLEPKSEPEPKPKLERKPEPKPRSAANAATPGEAKAPRRRRRGTAEFEERIGYRFKDSGLLEQALSHISAFAGARNRAGSYQRLEFLGDHVLGLVVSDMLFAAFPRADEGELSRR